MFLLLLLLLTTHSHAVSRGSGLCVTDLFDGDSVNCAAEDAELRGFFVQGNVTMECMLGENVTAHLFARIASNAAMRYDFGIVIALDDGVGETGTCANFNLQPVSVDNTDVDVMSGVGPFYNGDSDACGDVRSSDGETTVDLGVITFECVDRDMNGMADIAGAIAWDNQASMGTPQKPHCTGPDDVMPGMSKCQFGTVDIDTMIAMPQTTVEETTDSTSTASTSTVEEPTGSTSTTSSTESTTTTTTTPIQSNSSPVWLIGLIVGGVFASLLLFCCVAFPRRCQWFDPRTRKYFKSVQTGGQVVTYQVVPGNIGTLIHQPPFEVRIAASGTISVINAPKMSGNVLYLDANRNYAFNICNGTNRPVFNVFQGLLVKKAAANVLRRIRFGDFDLFLEFNNDMETKTIGTYRGAIRLLKNNMY